MIQEGLHYDKKCGCKDCKMTTLLDKPIKEKRYIIAGTKGYGIVSEKEKNEMIKAKTPKKKLEKTLKDTEKIDIEKILKDRTMASDGYGHYYIGYRGVSKEEFDKELMFRKLDRIDKNTGNFKPSIELIEKLDLHDMVKEHLNTDTIWDVNSWILLTIINKINEALEKINEHSVRLNLIDEEDNN